MRKTEIRVFLVWTQWCSRFGKVSWFFIMGPSQPMPKEDDVKIHTHTHLCAAVCSFVHNHPKLKTTRVSTRWWQISKLVFLCDETVLTQQLRKRLLACWHGWVSDTSCRVEGQVRQPAYYVMPSV